MQEATSNLLTNYERFQRVAVKGACLSAALAAFVSLNPYFMWQSQKVYYAISMSLLIIFCLSAPKLFKFTPERIYLTVIFCLFLGYLSILPKVVGGFTRWYLLIPFGIALINMRREHLRDSFDKFYLILAISLIPGMLIWIWLAAGLPIEARYLIMPPEISQREVTEYFEFPGAVFLQSNALMLPNSGMLFRLCGVFDEPGTAGTIAALCLAVTGYRLNDFRGIVAFTAGIMSFSIAFAVLSSVGLLAAALAARRPRLLLFLLATAGMAYIPFLDVPYQAGTPTSIDVVRPTDTLEWKPDSPPTVRYNHNLPPDLRLRYSRDVDDRALPPMRELWEKYQHSSMAEKLFGLGSDASVLFGGGSAIWYSVLTNYGAVGFLWLFVLCLLPLVFLLRSGKLNVYAIIFCGVYLMSFYQRPVIWMPAQLLIYLAGLYYYASRSASRPREIQLAQLAR